MSLSGEIAGKPGGAQLAEELRKLERSQPEAIQAVARRWSEAASASASAKAELARATRGLDGAWEGASADAFVSYMGKVTGGFDRAGQALESSASAMSKAADAVRAAKNALSMIGERALTDASKAEQAFEKTSAAHGDDEAAKQRAAQVRDDAIRRAMRGHVQDAQRKIAEVREELNGALRAVNGPSSELAGAFSKTPSASEHNFTPAPGRRVEWEFTPPPGPPPSTETASSASGGGAPDAATSSAGGSAGGSSDASSGAGSGGSGGLGSSGGPPTSGPPPGNVDQWIREAIRILRAHGIPVTEENIDEIWTIIEKESGGDPHAINTWDSNAEKGTPSKGLMQCIDPTFETHKLPGHDDIYNPVDNIIAGVRYTFDRYGGFEGHPGLQSMAEGGGYQGY